jgi:hypothetical protein
MVAMDAAMLSMTARMSANCSSVDLALGGGGVDMVATEVDRRAANNGGGGAGGWMRSAGGGKKIWL